MMTVNRTHNPMNLSEENQTKLLALLNQHVVDLRDLEIQVKLAHWNIKGMHFIALHELFDKFSGNLLGFIDLAAERVTTLGGVVTASVQQIAKNTQVEPYPETAHDGRSMLEMLAKRYRAYALNVRLAIAQSAALDDPATSDLFTEIAREIEKDLWFIEAHLL